MKKPAKIRAQAFLATTIAAMRKSGTLRLGPYAELARQAGVSPMTMLKVLRESRDRGELTLSHGSGATILPMSSSANTYSGKGAENVTCWRRVHEDLYADIVKGRYSSELLLPTYKLLQERYGASYPTIRHALEELTKNGYIEPTGRRYRICGHTIHRSRNRLVLIMFGGEHRGSELMRFQSKRCLSHLYSIQHACVKAELHLELVTIYYSGSRLTGFDTIRALADSQAAANQTILGFVLWDITLPPDAVRRILHILNTSQRPISLLNETGRSLVPDAVLRSGRFKEFSLASSMQCGRDVGDFLLKKRHRHVAYVCSQSPTPVVRARFKGVGESFRTAGIANAVEFVSPAPDTPVAPPADNLAAIFEIGQKLRGDEDIIRRELTTVLERVESQMVLDIDNAFNLRVLRRKLFVVLDRLLESSDCSAWVAYNDFDAIGCLDFLESRGIEVPGQIAVVGFDDSPDAIYHQLTSYNFGGDAIMHALVEHIINPSMPLPGKKGLSFDGYIMERRTT